MARRCPAEPQATRTVDTTSRGRALAVCLLVPGLLCPRNLGEERVDGPEVPGGLVAADAVAGTGHHDGPDQVVVQRLLPGRHRRVRRHQEPVSYTHLRAHETRHD